MIIVGPIPESDDKPQDEIIVEPVPVDDTLYAPVDQDEIIVEPVPDFDDTPDYAYADIDDSPALADIDVEIEMDVDLDDFIDIPEDNDTFDTDAGIF